MPGQINNQDLQYRIVRSKRKTMALEIRGDGEIIVRVPQTMSEVRIRSFVEQKRGWILKNLQKIQSRGATQSAIPRLTKAQREEYRRKASLIFAERTAYYADIIGVEYGRITIREQKTRWGSCSTSRNLNYNWKLVLAPREVLDYVVVHELCHLKQMNHSREFWAEVEKVLPDYQRQRRWLKDCGWMLMEA